MNEPWTRMERLTALALPLTALLVIAAFLAVPQISQMLKRERDPNRGHANAAETHAGEVLVSAAQNAPPVVSTHTETSGKGTTISQANADSSRNAATPAASDRGTAKTSGVDAKSIEMAPPESEPDPVTHRAEEDADVGLFRGRVTVCRFGIAPDQRQGSMYTFDRSPLCLETDSKVVRLQLDQRVLNEPPVFYEGRQYGLRQLHVGDEIEAEMVGEGEMRAAILARIQLVKKANR